MTAFLLDVVDSTALESVHSIRQHLTGGSDPIHRHGNILPDAAQTLCWRFVVLSFHVPLRVLRAFLDHAQLIASPRVTPQRIRTRRGRRVPREIFALLLLRRADVAQGILVREAIIGVVVAG